MNAEIRRRLRAIKAATFLVRSGGSLYHRQCNLCGYSGPFGVAGRPPRYDAQCPECRSIERHRLFWHYISEHPETLTGRETLHFAPEPILQRMIRPAASKYVTADIEPERADLVINIEAIALPEGSFDTVICLHVLEHVDDRKALSELFRIIRPGGSLLTMVPIIEGWGTTYENPGIIKPEDRERYYGQHDHVRLYGSDFRARVKRAGFDLTGFTVRPELVHHHGLLPGETLFIGTKPGSP